MRITRLRLENWRNFRDLDIALPARAFFVGPNAAGKSNLLDAMRFLHDLAAASGGGLQAAVAAPRRGGVAALRCLVDPASPGIGIDAEIGDDAGPRWRYALRFDAEPGTGRAVVLRETVWNCAADPAHPLLDRPDAADRADPERLSQTQLEQTAANRAFRPVAAFFRSIRSLHPPAGTASGDGPGDGFAGAALPAAIAAADPALRGARLERIAAALRLAVPQLDALAFETEAGVPHLKARHTPWPPGLWQREDQFSDGTRHLIGLLWLMLEDGGPLLLEEPELSLHPAVVAQLPSMIWRASQRAGRQSLITTHADALLDDEGIGLDEVFVLRPGAQGAEIDRPADHPDIRAMVASGLPLSEAVMPLAEPREAFRLPLAAGGWT